MTSDVVQDSWFMRLRQFPRRVYDWTLSWANTPYGAPALFVLAFVESSFFLVPPDVLLIPLCLERRRRALMYAALCTAGSVSGAVLGWYIGASLWQGLGEFAECPQYGGGAWLFEHVPGFSCKGFAFVDGAYKDNAYQSLFMAGFTPIPFKIFTIAAGVVQLSLTTLIIGSTIGRASRFFLVAGLIYYFGPPVKKFIEERFELISLVGGALLVGGFVLIKLLL